MKNSRAYGLGYFQGGTWTCFELLVKKLQLLGLDVSLSFHSVSWRPKTP